MLLYDYDHPADGGNRLQKIIIISIVGFVSFVLIVGGIYCCNKKRKDSRARLAARRERVRVLIYDTSDPPQFGQTECVVCWHEFANIQTYSCLPCGYIFCEECLSKYIIKREECPVCRVKT
jgi:hypothetical protein